MTERRISSLSGARTRTELPMPEEATVLIVEDDPVLRSTLAYNLVREGFRVIPAADGESGLDVRARTNIRGVDVVVLDVMLPGYQRIAGPARIRSRSDVPVHPDALRAW